MTLSKTQFLAKKTRGGVVRNTLPQAEQDSAWRAYLGSIRGAGKQQGGQSTRAPTTGGKTAGWVPGEVIEAVQLATASKEAKVFALTGSGTNNEIFDKLPAKCKITSIQLEVDMPLSKEKRSWAIGVLKSDITSKPTTQKVRELAISQSSQEEVVCKNYPLSLGAHYMGKGLDSSYHAEAAEKYFLILVAQCTGQASIDFKVKVKYVAPKGSASEVMDIS